GGGEPGGPTGFDAGGPKQMVGPHLDAAMADRSIHVPSGPLPDAGLIHVHAEDAAVTSRADAACAAVEQAAEALPSTAAGIVWIVDNSGSMTFEAQFVQNNLNVFSRLISGGGVDARVVLISATRSGTASAGSNGMCIAAPLGSGSCPDDTSYPRLFHVPVVVN